MIILENTVSYIFPFFILFTISYGFFKKTDILLCFKKGFVEGITTIWEIMPNIVAVVVASTLFKESGAFYFMSKLLTPVFSVFNIPRELYEMVIMRPVSGSGSIAVLNNIFNTSGADSKVAVMAAVISASTETTLYTIGVYMGVTGAKKLGIPIAVGLLADFFTVVFTVFLINFIF